MPTQYVTQTMLVVSSCCFDPRRGTAPAGIFGGGWQRSKIARRGRGSWNVGRTTCV